MNPTEPGRGVGEIPQEKVSPTEKPGDLGVEKPQEEGIPQPEQTRSEIQPEIIIDDQTQGENIQPEQGINPPQTVLEESDVKLGEINTVSQAKELLDKINYLAGE